MGGGGGGDGMLPDPTVSRRKFYPDLKPSEGWTGCKYLLRLTTICKTYIANQTWEISADRVNYIGSYLIFLLKSIVISVQIQIALTVDFRNLTQTRPNYGRNIKPIQWESGGTQSSRFPKPSWSYPRANNARTHQYMRINLPEPDRTKFEGSTKGLFWNSRGTQCPSRFSKRGAGCRRQTLTWMRSSGTRSWIQICRIDLFALQLCSKLKNCAKTPFCSCLDCRTDRGSGTSSRPGGEEGQGVGGGDREEVLWRLRTKLGRRSLQ